VHWKTPISGIIGVLFFASTGTSVWAGTGTNEACSLLTQAQVSAVLGVSVSSGKDTVPGASRSCTWSEPGATMVSGKSVRLEILGPLGSMTPVDRFEKNVKKRSTKCRGPHSAALEMTLFTLEGATWAG